MYITEALETVGDTVRAKRLTQAANALGIDPPEGDGAKFALTGLITPYQGRESNLSKFLRSAYPLFLSAPMWDRALKGMETAGRAALAAPAIVLGIPEDAAVKAKDTAARKAAELQDKLTAWLAAERTLFKVLRGRELVDMLLREDAPYTCLKDHPDRVKFFGMFPEKISGLFAFDKEGKITGRAMMYHADNGKVAIDPPRGIAHHAMQGYAEAQGWEIDGYKDTFCTLDTSDMKGQTLRTPPIDYMNRYRVEPGKLILAKGNMDWPVLAHPNTHPNFQIKVQ